jgi:hypothetical protein
MQDEDVFLSKVKQDPQARGGIHASNIEDIVLHRGKPADLVTAARFERVPAYDKPFSGQDILQFCP